MSHSLPTSLLSSRSSRVELARQRFFEEGIAPTGMVSDAVFESWAHCLRLRHSPRARASFEPVTLSRSHSALQKNRDLHQAWQRELPRLAATLGASTCAAMLTDSTGILIGSTCAGRPHEELMPVATRIGVNLSEDAVGTTAPGIVVRTGKPVRVYGGEHFFEAVQTMHCAAAPIRDIHGRLAGVLDLSSESIPFAFDPTALVGLYAGAIENNLLIQQSTDHLLVRFQVSPELLDSAMVALVGVDTNGRVAWANTVAKSLLGHPAAGAGASGQDPESMLGTDLATLHQLPAEGARLLPLANGLMVWARAERRMHDGALRVHAVAAPAVVQAPAQPDAPMACADGAMDAPAGPQVDEPLTLRDIDRDLILRTLARCKGNISEAARQLGVSRGLIYRRRQALLALEASEAQAVNQGGDAQASTPSH